MGCTTYHDNEGEVGGRVNVSQALTVSSDIFFYNLGVQFWDDYKGDGQYGEYPIQDTAAQYGYGDVTGIDLPDETHYARVDSPKVVDREHAQDPKDYPNGAGARETTSSWPSARAARSSPPSSRPSPMPPSPTAGPAMSPRWPPGLVNAHGKVVKTIAPKVAGHISISPADYQAMLAGFEGAVQNPKGTAAGDFTGFPLSSFPLAGKTGTATTNEQQPNSWFVAWGPVPDPQYLIAVVIQGGGLGSRPPPRWCGRASTTWWRTPRPPPGRPGHDPGDPVAPTDHNHHHVTGAGAPPARPLPPRREPSPPPRRRPGRAGL